jgi:outer membrane protein assembly factor BamB
MAMNGGVLHVMAGPEGAPAKIIKGDRSFGGWSWGDLSAGYYHQPRVPWGFGKTVAAFDPEKKRLLWKHEEGDVIDSRAMAMLEDRLFLYCPEKHLRCLNSRTGEVLWTNNESEVSQLIEQPGKGLVSTPGFRSSCLAVATPEALILQGQTRMNVVSVSAKDGSLLWSKKKFTNNPNVIYVDGRAILGIGSRGAHLAVDPVTGEVLENLNFQKVGCTRLTASSDSFFVRGEGTLRFDRATGKALIDGAVRPACNDGAIPANGMLYLGPWACDCNLSLIGAMAKCSAGDFRFERLATEDERLELGEGNIDRVASFEITGSDWATYRADNQRTGSTKVRLTLPREKAQPPGVSAWTHRPERPYVPTPPTSAGGMVFVGGTDGKVRALDSSRGEVVWAFSTGGPIKAPPSLWEGRAFVGSGDGYAYALEAATGRLLWRFRAAPVERHIMVYGNLASTWPVNTGILIQDGIAYFAAGIVDTDGTYVYALDARTGKIKWQNNTCGHLNPTLRKGVSAQGNLTIHGRELLMAGGNQVSPARFDLETGKCLNQSFAQGQPKAHHGRFVGVFMNQYPLAGGRALYASPKNVANKDRFEVIRKGLPVPLNFGGVPPAWNGDVVAMVNYRYGNLKCYDSVKVARRVRQGLPSGDDSTPRSRRFYLFSDAFDADDALVWETDLGAPKKFETVSLALTPDWVATVVRIQTRGQAHPRWQALALDAQDGTPVSSWRHDLTGEPLPGGLAIGREGQLIVTMLDGSVCSLAPQRPPAG